MRRLLPEVVNLQSLYGGPIIAVQVENEYGMYFNSDQDHLRRVFIQCNRVKMIQCSTITYDVVHDMDHVIWSI